jgi:hypothetical protein
MLKLLLLIGVFLGLAAAYVLPPAFRDLGAPASPPPVPSGGDERE